MTNGNAIHLNGLEQKFHASKSPAVLLTRSVKGMDADTDNLKHDVIKVYP